MAINFGKSQLKNPTPSRLAGWVQGSTVVIGILIGWIGTAPFISSATSTNLQSILGLLLAIGNGLLPFFGVETTQKNVPIADVSQMDETKTDK